MRVEVVLSRVKQAVRVWTNGVCSSSLKLSSETWSGARKSCWKLPLKAYPSPSPISPPDGIAEAGVSRDAIHKWPHLSSTCTGSASHRASDGWDGLLPWPSVSNAQPW